MIGKLFRRFFGCTFGTHYRPEYINDEDHSGISRGGRCLDCGYTWEPIKWPDPPPMPVCKKPRTATSHDRDSARLDWYARFYMEPLSEESCRRSLDFGTILAETQDFRATIDRMMEREHETSL